MDRRTVWAILIMMVIAIAPALLIKRSPPGAANAPHSTAGDSAGRVDSLAPAPTPAAEVREQIEDTALPAAERQPAAEQLGVGDKTGSIDVGKDADIAIFSAHPFAPAARVEMTLVDGRKFFDRAKAPTLEAMIKAMKKGVPAT